MKNNLIGLTVGVALAVIFVGALLVPSIQEFSKVDGTFTNGALYYMTDLGDDSITYTYDGTAWTVNGESVDFSISDATTIIAGDGFIMRSNGQIRGNALVTPISIESLTVTSSGLTGSYTKGDSTTAAINVIGTVYYCAVGTETDYVLCPYDEPVYVHGDSEIFADGLSYVQPGVYSIFKIEGTISDGFTVTPQLNSVTVSDVVCNYEVIDEYQDLYLLSSITFNTTYSGTEITQTYSSYIVPAEITSELTNHLTDSEIVLLGIIPVFAIMAILCGFTYVIMRGRDY